MRAPIMLAIAMRVPILRAAAMRAPIMLAIAMRAPILRAVAIRRRIPLAIAAVALLGGCADIAGTPDAQMQPACMRAVMHGVRATSDRRDERFLGKVDADTARCRGGERALAAREAPYVDWPGYFGAGDARSLPGSASSDEALLGADRRGVDGALVDLERQRVELIRFNLFDNGGTYREYVQGRDGVAGPALRRWDELRLPRGHPGYAAVGGDGVQQCTGQLIRFRNVDGICNDIRNPRMGATNEPFARNVQFEATFPDLGFDAIARNRHGARLDLLTPDPQVISRKLFTRAQSTPQKCNGGLGLPDDDVAANCDYVKAPAFNVLGAFWIQFMTHDWFSHLVEGHNDEATMAMGCTHERVANVERPLTAEARARLGCRDGDRVDRAYVADAGAPGTFMHDGRPYLTRAYRTSRNTVTAWWDASQLYGYDRVSRQRVKRDPADRARLLLVAADASPDAHVAGGYLPSFAAGDPINPQWAGQEATAFPDNWSIGTSFFHNLFAREHDAFVDAFRAQAARTPDADCGLRDPAHAREVIRYRDVSPDALFEIARLVVAAEIAKIHTTEWTPQLLYDEPLHRAANANWGGLVDRDDGVAAALAHVVGQALGTSSNARDATAWYSVFASGPGIFGLGSHVYPNAVAATMGKPDLWDLTNPDHVNGGVNHFGSPFNFPEEFVTVYRLHALVPDLIDYREWDRDPNVIRRKIPVVKTVRAAATGAMHERGLANWALSMGRQRAGRLTLGNYPMFLQNLDVPRLPGATRRIDLAALDILRDREHGVPRFNEFRRQYGLRQLRSFDDFVDTRLPRDSPERHEQQRWVAALREVYGQHRCDASKVITQAQVDERGAPITDCLGFPAGTLVDNVEDVDTIVGWLGESRRPHGFAISETQLQVFILNASRRLFSDRFFTSSFRPEFYTSLGVRWVEDNGPDGRQREAGRPNGHAQDVSPLKRVLLRNVPELRQALAPVINAFDPWARDRGTYYSLQWKPRPDARTDPAFHE